MGAKVNATSSRICGALVTRGISARADCVQALLGRLRSMASRDGVFVQEPTIPEPRSNKGYSKSAGRLDNGRQCDVGSGKRTGKTSPRHAAMGSKDRSAS